MKPWQKPKKKKRTLDSLYFRWKNVQEIETDKALKIFKGKKRLAKRMNPDLFGKWASEYEYFRTLKVGDLYHSCDGFNHRVKTIKKTYAKKGRTRVFIGADILSDDDMFCEFPQCASPLMSSEDIKKYWLNWNTPKGLEDSRMYGWAEVIEGFRDGKKVIDEDGIFLGTRDQEGFHI